MKLNNFNVEHPDTQFLRAFGIILIINSHLDRYYPIPYIGTGGAIGNSIFFFLSAFGLYISQQERRKEFTQWIAHRIGRIYPSLWIVLISLYMPVMIWKGELSYSTIIKFIGDFFNPPFWFLQYLLVYYLLTFRLLTNRLKAAKVFMIYGLLSLLYISCYASLIDLSRWSVEESPFDMIHYLMVFIYGIYIAKYNKDINYSGIKDYVFLFLIVALFYGQKYLLLKGYYFEFQFLQHLAMYPILFYLLKICRSPFIETIIMRSPTLSRALDFIANHTLEIYMVHQTISSVVLHLKMPFPMNMIIFLLVTLCLSAVVSRLANNARERIA